jgi:hypothetical protein
VLDDLLLLAAERVVAVYTAQHLGCRVTKGRAHPAILRPASVTHASDRCRQREARGRPVRGGRPGPGVCRTPRCPSCPHDGRREGHLCRTGVVPAPVMQ